MREIHPIERQSYRIMRDLVDLSHLPPLARAVAERVIHASADLEYAGSLALDETALTRGREALLNGAPVVCDVGMVAAGITAREATSYVAGERAREVAAGRGITRSAAGFRVALEEEVEGAVWVVGNAPTALYELLELEAERSLSPALVVGLPVGFVGAAESKDALLASGLPAVANRGMKGGSAVAAAAVNALIYHEQTEEE